jgi:CrcB protein
MPAALAVALGGAFGALARYGAGRLVAHLLDPSFPWATWTVNLLGCFLVGMTVPLVGRLGGIEEARFFLVVGFLGSFTTFSTYCLDTVALWGDGRGLFAALNVGGSVVCGLLLVAVGRELSAWLLGG